MLPPTIQESSLVLRHVAFNEATFPHAHPASLFSSIQNNNFVATYEEFFEWQYPLKNDSCASTREASQQQATQLCQSYCPAESTLSSHDKLQLHVDDDVQVEATLSSHAEMPSHWTMMFMLAYKIRTPPRLLMAWLT